MALTESEKTEIRLYLGWPMRHHDTDSALEQGLRAIDGIAEVLALIQGADGLLAKLNDVDSRLEAALNRLKADKASDVTLNRREQSQIRQHGHMLCLRLGQLVGVEMRTSPYAIAGKGYTSAAYGAQGAPNAMRRG